MLSSCPPQTGKIFKNQPLSCLLAFVLFLPFFMGLIGCSSAETSVEDAAGLYQEGENDFKDEDYLSAMDKFRAVKNRFPYSAKAVEAELRIADTYYAQEAYIEAEGAYEVFQELHPAYPRADYIQYRIGMSYYMQIPDTIARDLTAAHKAVEAFKLFEQKFPQSSYLEESRKHLKEARRRLAEHEDYVANFYFQREHFLSASYRYASLLRSFPNLGFDELALYRLGQCYYHIHMYANARDALSRLMQRFPQSSYRADATELLKQLRTLN